MERHGSEACSTPRTNRLFDDLRAILTGHERNVMLRPDARAAVLRRIGDEAKSGLYNNVRQSNFDVNAGDYLAGLEIHNTDYRNLFEEYKNVPGVIFLVDPPYLSTDTKTYASDKYWTLRDYLDVLKVLKGTQYVYFTSDKSALPELGRWLGDNAGIGNPFDGAELKTRTNHVNPSACYEDMMLCKLCA